MKPCRYSPRALIFSTLTLLACATSIASEPKPEREAFQKGKACAEKADYDAAIADFTEAIRLDPKFARAYCGRGVAYWRKGDNDKAIADYSESIRLDPKLDAAYFDRGLAYNSKGEFGKAIADATESIRLAPQDAKAYCNRGCYYEGNCEYDKALLDYTEAIRLAPQDATAYEGRGIAHQMKGEQSAAECDFAQATKFGYKPPTFLESVEQDIASWRPDHEDLRPLLGKHFQAKAEIAGDWEISGMDGGSSLSIRKKESGGYSVAFSTGGCAAQWDFKREATYESGVFHLNKPVEEYRPAIYDTLYAISVDGADYLTSQSVIRYIVKQYSKNGVVDWSEHVKFFAFHKADKK